MPTFIEQLAEQHLGDPLPADFIELTRPLDDASEEARGWMRRAFRAMERERFRPRDFSEELAAALVRLPSTLPGAWLGSPPSITQPGRHARLDDYLEHNRLRPPQADDLLIDVGCGFPPVTTLDTAARFPALQILGIDPGIGHYLVYDAAGDYAVFGRTGDLRFCYPGEATPERRAQLLGDIPGARAHFQEAFARLLPLLPTGDNPAEVRDRDERILREPVRSYETPRMHFSTAAIGDEDVPQADFIRCMNVLGYFPPSFERATREWAGSRLRFGGLFLQGANGPIGRGETYSVWQRGERQLVPREFALGPSELRSSQAISWWTLYENDTEMELRTSVLGALWSLDDAFRSAFDDAFDALLAQFDFGARRPDGFLGAPTPGLTVAASRERWAAIESRLVADGWVDRAAEALTRSTGKRAWRNAIGHLAVDPVEWGWDPIDLE